MMLHPYVPQRPDEQPQEVPTPRVYVTEAVAWEYRQLSHDLEEEGAPDEEALNRLGAEGWELAAVVTHGGRMNYIFKRLVN